MNKLFKNKLFLAISAGIIILLLSLIYYLRNEGLLILPEIRQIQLYEKIEYSLGYQKIIELLWPYSRFWDLVIFPPTLLLIIGQWRRMQVKNNPWIAGLTMLVTLFSTYFLASAIFAVYSGAALIIIFGLIFGNNTAILLSLLLGVIIGLTVCGLLYGLLIGFLAWTSFWLLKEIIL
jgi:hypothetical protein